MRKACWQCSSSKPPASRKSASQFISFWRQARSLSDIPFSFFSPLFFFLCVCVCVYFVNCYQNYWQQLYKTASRCKERRVAFYCCKFEEILMGLKFMVTAEAIRNADQTVTYSVKRKISFLSATRWKWVCRFWGNGLLCYNCPLLPIPWSQVAFGWKQGKLSCIYGCRSMHTANNHREAPIF